MPDERLEAIRKNLASLHPDDDTPELENARWLLEALDARQEGVW